MDTAANALRSGLVVYAKNKDRVAGFYRQTLALRAVEEDDSYVVLQAEGVEIIVLKIPDRIASAITIATPPEAREDTPFKPTFIVRSLATVCGAAVSSNGNVDPLQNGRHLRGTVVLDWTDPEGNVVPFRQTVG